MGIATLVPPAGALDDLIAQVEELRRDVMGAAAHHAARIDALPGERQVSATNLVHYLAMRSRDLRSLQDQLSRHGLSSLGRLESHVLATIDLVLENLYRLGGIERPRLDLSRAQASFDASDELSERNCERLLGPQPKDRRVHIMVTIPATAADDYLLFHQLLKSGMNCMRINCAKDGPGTWSQMIGHLSDARRATGLECRVLMDLGGPKLRTGAMEAHPGILKVRPLRGRDGRIERPARIWLTPNDHTVSHRDGADANLPVDRDWLAFAECGDRIRLRDARGAKRVWRITDVGEDGCWAESDKTTYVTNGTGLRLHGANGVQTINIEGLPGEEAVLEVRHGDILYLEATDGPGRPARHDETGKLLDPGHVPLPIPEVFRDVRPGESVYFDDGRIAGIVEKTLPERIQVRVLHTNRPVEKLRSDRGVNLPDTRLDLPALSDKDLSVLEFVARNADIVGLSFTNRAGDVADLRHRLQKLGREDLGVVLKIETRRGFSNLPDILFEALRIPACGVMIARGDLAVECGFERMAELQEEILWLCESAHVPVIWATQVLENLTRRGFASRAEITDAAMGQSAEAVMLNKGPHVAEAVRMLDDILRRMQGHHNKKRSVMRRLELASAFSVRESGQTRSS